MYLNKYLEGKTYFVGEIITLADIHIWGYLQITFEVGFDEGFRKAIPNLTAWFVRISQVQEVKDRFGAVQMAQKAMKPFIKKTAAVEKPKANAAEKPKAEVKVQYDKSHVLFNSAKFNVFTHTCMIAANVVEFKDLQEVMTD